MTFQSRRTPKNYDGTGVTSRRIGELLPNALSKIGEVFHDRPDLVLAAWADVIGAKLAPMTQAESFVNGVLSVKVKNSTLLSLLSQYEKGRIVANLKKKFPRVPIHNVVFRIG